MKPNPETYFAQTDYSAWSPEPGRLARMSEKVKDLSLIAVAEVVRAGFLGLQNGIGTVELARRNIVHALESRKK